MTGPAIREKKKKKRWLAGLLSDLQKLHFKNFYKNEIFTESLALV